MHKKVNENLCILPIDEKTARDARTRAAKKMPSNFEGIHLFFFFVAVFPHLNENLAQLIKHYHIKASEDTNESPTKPIGDRADKF
jgi:hypothetical protein